MTDEMQEYAMNLVLLGIAIARDGDGDFVREFLRPELMMGTLQKKALTSIQNRDRVQMRMFLDDIGVTMLDGETAAGSIFRTHVDIAEARTKISAGILSTMPRVMPPKVKAERAK